MGYISWLENKQLSGFTRHLFGWKYGSTPSTPNPINMTVMSCSIRQDKHVSDELRIDESAQDTTISKDTEI